MKKYLKFLLFFVAIGLVFTAFAQDVPVAPSFGINDLFNYLVAFIPAKYKGMVISSLTVLFLLEQILASTAKVKANSTFQLVSGWVSSAIGSIIGKKN